jgi:hypothetical protein
MITMEKFDFGEPVFVFDVSEYLSEMSTLLKNQHITKRPNYRWIGARMGNLWLVRLTGNGFEGDKLGKAR